MRILGVETSCDDTAAAVVAGGRLRSSVVLSQLARHRPFRGVVPELASRAHLELITLAVEQALRKARTSCVDAVAYTAGPGLMGPLLVGKVWAQTLARLRGIPALGINHLEGHILAAELEHRVRWPMIGLIASGGHTDLVLARAPGCYQMLGRTRDDAAGEAYDKVARLLGLGYPGGPAIDRLASWGNAQAVLFPRPEIAGWDFSFSGLKTAVLYHLREHGPARGRRRADLCASFQETVAESLVKKTMAAARRFGAKDIAIGGGVAANSRLRALLQERCRESGFRALLPSRALCTDNAAMIAWAASRRLNAGVRPRSLRADPSLALRSWRPFLKDIGLSAQDSSRSKDPRQGSCNLIRFP